MYLPAIRAQIKSLVDFIKVLTAYLKANEGFELRNTAASPTTSKIKDIKMPDFLTEK